MNKIIFTAAAISLITGASASAQVINFDARGGAIYTDPGTTTTFSNPNYSGVSPAGSGTIWNPVVPATATTPGVTANDLTSTGAPTNVTLTDTTFFVSGYPSNPQGAYFESGDSATNFFNGYLYSTTGMITDTLNNVAPGTYNLFLYGQNAGFPTAGYGNETEFSLADGTSQIVNNKLNPTESFQLGTNYVEFMNVSPIGGAISFNYSGGVGGGAEGDFSGVSLQFVVAQVPEPSSYVLLGVGALALCLVNRFRGSRAS
jgi:hypothetical protein